MHKLNSIRNGVLVSAGKSSWAHSRIVFVNETACDLFGESSSIIQTRSPADLFCEPSFHSAYELIESQLEFGQSCVVKLPINNPNSSNSPAGMLAEAEVSITSLRKVETDLPLYLSILSIPQVANCDHQPSHFHVVEGNKEAIATFDKAGEIKCANPAADLMDRTDVEELVLDTVSQERWRIGSELHDNIQQQLAGLRMLATALAESLAQQASPEANAALRLADGINQANRQIHQIARGLVPLRAEASIQDSLSELLNRASEQYDIDCQFEFEGVVHLEKEVASHLLRIAQEAINNAIKHGKASCIRIALVSNNELVQMRVINNGAAVFPDSPVNGDGVGLRIMRDRANAIGGEVKIHSSPAGETIVDVRLKAREPARSPTEFRASSPS